VTTEVDDRLLQLYFGEANQAAARIYVDYCGDLPSDTSVVGVVRGPFCHYARTLAATVKLSASSMTRAAALLPDPCFWTPEAPYYYDVAIQIRRGGETIASADRKLGLRRLAARGADLLLDGRRCVIRGCRGSEAEMHHLAEYHQESLAIQVESPSEAFCDRASTVGVLILAQIAEGAADTAAEVRRLSAWPAVGIVLVPQESRAETIHGPNLLFGAKQPPRGLDRHARARWVRLCWDPAESLPANLDTPLIAVRTSQTPLCAADARRQCDLLQRKLAPLGQFAGYLV
jgi:hypothetical protein